MVVSSYGRHRFQTGIITAELLRRGVAMDRAMQVARKVKDDLSGKKSVTADELETSLSRQFERVTGAVLPPVRRKARKLPLVSGPLGAEPFSPGNLVRRMTSVGLSLETGLKLYPDIERWIARQEQVDAGAVAARTAQVLAGITDGVDYARRFALFEHIEQSPVPIVILIGGATGAGKSSLAVELGNLLGIHWVSNTDMVRAAMRSVIAPEFAPGLHAHSFGGLGHAGDVVTDPRQRVLAGFRQQCAQVALGVRAVVQRAVQENQHIIVEGVHLVPPFIDVIPRDIDFRSVGLVLAVPDEERHRERFRRREKIQKLRAAATYLDRFEAVRAVHDDLLQEAEETDAVVVANEDVADTLIDVIDYLSYALIGDGPG